MRFSLLTILPALAAAGVVPQHDGMKVLWSENFIGAAGSPPSSQWKVMDAFLDHNQELQTYTTSNRNLQLSGGGTVQLVPWRGGQHGWTSARIETYKSWTPAPGRITQVEGLIRMGDAGAARQKGMWPAFWMLGQAVREGTPWPRCGELDIFEQRNGEPVGFGTAHCGEYPGGPCNEGSGRGATTGIPDGDWHTWTMRWDRTSGDWTRESITWYRDGQLFHTLTGGMLGDQAIWATLAHSPMYIILNVAVGGIFPGNPNGDTVEGYGSMMEVQYVAVYESN